MARPTDHPYGQRILKFEQPLMEGLDVWELQVKLIGWGSGTDNDGIGNVMDPVRLTSKFDATTRDAVMRFKKAHGLPVTGIADAMLMRVIDREAVLHPVLMWDLMCPCTTGVNDGDPLCRCTKHEEDGKGKKCDGFGKERFAGKFILETKKLADGTELKDEKLDVYDKEEYPGMDKTVLWAVRAILHRSKVQTKSNYNPVQVVSGYRCWWDNYHHTDDIRWHHRRSTFHFGKAIEFYIHGHCTEIKWDDNKNSCPQCDAIRKAALEKCGFQSRWQEPGRVTIAEGTKDARPPATPFSIHVDTVRLHPRNADANKTLEYKDQFVKSDIDAIKPLYDGKIKTVFFPVELGEGIDPLSASSAKYFRTIEKSEGGWFPLGRSRIWHGGVHLPAPATASVHAIADGEIIGCRVGETENKNDYGSRNFVLVKHTIKAAGKLKDKIFYCLYMHLDGEKATAKSMVAWRRELFYMTKDHVEVLLPSPIFDIKSIDGKNRLFPKPGLEAGKRHPVKADPVGAKTVDDRMPDAWKVIELDAPAGAGHYLFTKKKENGVDTDYGKKYAAVANLTDKIDNAKVIGLERPIKIKAGEVIGKVPRAAKHDSLKGQGSFIHLETFAYESLPLGDGFVTIDIADATKITHRKESVAALVGKDLIPTFPDGVVLESELKGLYEKPPYYTRLRSVILNMQNLWAVDWKKAFKDASCYGFLEDDKRDQIADAYNEYAWWTEVKAQKGDLHEEKVFHYHPISLIVQIAFSQ